MLEIIESFTYTHYVLKGVVIKGFKITSPQGRPLYFFKIKGDDGKNYDVNVPLWSQNYQKFQSKIGCAVVLKIEGYCKGGVEHYIFLNMWTGR